MSETRGEVITIQVGSVANNVMAHFWNLQIPRHSTGNSRTIEDSIANSTMFKAGSVGFVPRAVMIDTKGSFIGARIHTSGTDFGSEGTSTTTQAWDGKVESFQQQQQQKPKEKGKEEGFIEPESWGEALECAIHRRSICEVSEMESIDSWTDGELLSRGENGISETTSESVRLWAESLDRVDGFHCAIDSSSIFGSIGVNVLETLHDDFSHVPFITFLCSAPPTEKEERKLVSHPMAIARRNLCSVLSIHQLTPLSNLLIPLHEKSFGPMTLAIDSITLPHRLGLTPNIYETLFRYKCSSRNSAVSIARLISASNSDSLKTGNGDILRTLFNPFPMPKRKRQQSDPFEIESNSNMLQISRGTDLPLRWILPKDANIVECFGINQDLELPRTFPRCPWAVAGSDSSLLSVGRKTSFATLLSLPPSKDIDLYFESACELLKDPETRAVFSINSNSLPSPNEVSEELQAFSDLNH